MSNGYLLVTRYEVLYQRALNSHTYDNNPTGEAIYGIPFPPNPTPTEKMYRGIDREPLQALTHDEAKLFTEAGTPAEASAATNLLSEIENQTKRDDGWLTSLEDIIEVWKLLGSEQSNYEIIWAKEFKDPASVPESCQLLGCDAAYFVIDHFSCICDALFFPRWHGTDSEGVLFRKYYDSLNRNGLFDTNELALDYLRYYLSFDWTERDDNFTSIEVYAVEVPKV
jgi:hypothetical protein